MSQTPSIPRNDGNKIMPMIKKSKLREKEMIADILPLERAVKRAEVNILLPLSKKLSENN